MSRTANENASGQAGGFCAHENERSQILPDRPAVGNTAFAAEHLPTPLREPEHIAQVLVRFDAREPLPADAMSQVLAAICDARRRALNAAATPAKARPFWQEVANG